MLDINLAHIQNDNRIYQISLTSKRFYEKKQRKNLAKEEIN